MEIERAWHPATPMPGTGEIIHNLHAAGIPLGLLSNAQCDTLHALGSSISNCIATDLTVLSYQHGMAKPSPGLFAVLLEELAARGISPSETLLVGNDPLRDIVPAAAAGFRTALFTGHPDSLRPGDCVPDLVFEDWPQLLARRSWKMQGESGFTRSEQAKLR
jgi:FMN phosphatase YigB (HAD superfamily)